MIPIREKVPKRRLKPTRNPKGTKWSQHKPDLKEDFNCRCGYCDSYDGFRHTYFEVDHFIPKDFFGPLGNISLTQYDNLVYSCKFCNNAKLAKWPSQREDIYHINNEGFVDPTDDDYNTHFYRTKDGGIMWKTDLGKWMFSTAFKFDERQNGIIILWNLNRLRNILEKLTEVLIQYNKGTSEYEQIEAKRKEFGIEYYSYHQELMEYYG
jgi:5-methylcytosine-specific restriction endonuclease McrA